MTKTDKRLIERAQRKVRVRERQLDREVRRYAYWGAKPASSHGQEHFNAAMVNMRYWAGMYAFALADVEMLRARIKGRPRSSNGQ